MPAIMEQPISGPLAGLMVLEIGHYVAAPFCTRLLADLGAEVTKIEPLSGDPVRKWGEQFEGESLWWSTHGRNKKSVAVNLWARGAADLLLALVKRHDVVVENFRPGHLAALGLSDDAMRAANPGLIISHISGYGQDGPYRDRPAFGVIGEAIGGLRYLTNHPPGSYDLPPVRVGVSIGDSLAGLYAAFGIVAALWERDGKGIHAGRTVDVALSEAVLSMMEGMLTDYGKLGKIRQPSGSRISTAAPSSAYLSADGKWILIAANSDPLFERLSRLMGVPDLPQNPRFADNRSRVDNVDALDTIIGRWTRTLSAGELLEQLEAAEIPSTRVYTAADCAADPQFLHRGMVQKVNDPLLGAVLHVGVVPRIPENPGAIRWTGPSVGQHTEEALTSSGISRDQIDRFRAKGVVLC
jgi:crotonobetainyl-CoA:carnitine CoA-transferase CaiB-like acyl-CoA transferase